MIVTIIRLGQPGGLRFVVAESVLMRHHILILNRGGKRAPNLRSSDRIIAGLCTLFMRQARFAAAIVLKTSTLLHFHKMLVKQKYRLLFSLKRVRRRGPKGPTKELIDTVVEMKRQFSNPNYGPGATYALPNVQSGAFGQITSTSVNPRVVQFALKYSF